MTDGLNVEITLSNTFEPLLHDKVRYLVLCGGRGSGKSEFAARKIFWRCMTEGGHRFLVLRKVRNTIKQSVIRVMRMLLDENAVPYKFNATDRIISFRGNEILFDGLDEPEKIKSIKAISGVWIEEATEFTAKDFSEVDLAFREPGPQYKQIILCFNPDETLAPWLKARFFDSIDSQATVHNSTVEDNPIDAVREEYKRQLDEIQDETTRNIYRYGVWAAPKGRIFSWPVTPAPTHFDEFFYGLDFGYSVNPSSLIKVYRRGDVFWLEEKIYQAGLTNQGIAALMADQEIGRHDAVYADSAEPKSIDEIALHGFNVIPAQKGPDSVRAGIDLLKSKKIFIIDGSTNLIREAGRYKWREDRHGNTLPEPVKFDDHGIDAVRYAITTHLAAYASRTTFAVPDIDWRPR